MADTKPKRILLVDDNREIHKDFCKILSRNSADSFDDLSENLFGTEKKSGNSSIQEYVIDSAYQGQEALELVQKAKAEGYAYALAFIDMRMPPGWNGVETIKRIWEIDPNIQMVICSAYTDHSWEEITQELGASDNLLILKKPFEVIEINQLASALTRKWELIANLYALVTSRTVELEKVNSLTNATLESAHEGILAVGLDREVILYNTNFLKQWDIPVTVLQSENAVGILEHLSEKVVNSSLFLEAMNELGAHPRVNTQEWQLNSGVIFKIHTQPQYLDNKIIGIVFSSLDITEQKKLEQQLLHQATHDFLTGLPNRALLLDRMHQAISYAKRYDLQVGVLLLDLDAFKEINDSLGHKAGDLLLKGYAERLTHFLREHDTVARLGGDEFVIILTALEPDGNLQPLLQKLVKLFIKPFSIDGQEIIATTTIGVSVYPTDGDDVDTLLKNADAALYHAKEHGRNQYQFYQEEFKTNFIQRTELKKALGYALQNNEFSLHYQPLVDLKSSNIVGVEALLRWTHPELGSIPPATFIPVAEESGAILDIGAWVLRTACAQAKIWQDTSAYPDIKISINISIKQFKDKNFVALVKRVLDETQLKPEFLELEITENVILEDIISAIHKIIELKQLGIRFAIDDFGFGYSSISYLKHFPFDTVKIDKIFIENIATDMKSASIVESIIGLTKRWGVNVLAEGIEHEDQVNFLKTHQSNQVQGYYFSKPLDMQDCTKLLNKK